MDEDVQGKKIKLKKTKGGAQQYVRGDDLPERLRTINEMDDSYLSGKESEKRSRLTKAFLAEMGSENYAKGGMVNGKRGCGMATRGYGRALGRGK